ncbi:MAG: hypothetical protein ACLFM0_03855 [Spirochaetales bacterium]
MHKKYRVKSTEPSTTTMEITREVPSGYMVLIRTTGEWRRGERVEFISESLFQTCLRTGYITAVSETRAEQPAEDSARSQSVPA